MSSKPNSRLAGDAAGTLQTTSETTMFERLQHTCGTGGWLCWGVAAGADVTANHVVSTLTIAGLAAGLAFHLVGIACAIARRREESRLAKLRARFPYTYDQIEGRN